jgi:hypothetical protein
MIYDFRKRVLSPSRFCFSTIHTPQDITEAEPRLVGICPRTSANRRNKYHFHGYKTVLATGLLAKLLYVGCHLKGHLFKMGLTDDPICERCLEDDESATHILCDCEALDNLRFRHLGQFFMEPSDYYDAPINKVLHSIRSVGLIKG